MDKRLELHGVLIDILGTPNVYFQPPESHKIQYPCILYSRDMEGVRYADDELYLHRTGYMITVIDTNPDSEIPSKVRRLPLCSFVRHYVSDRLNHDVFRIYY